MNDVNCPYCGKPQEICHDDGYGYDESQTHQQECGDCEKMFTFTTFISFSYEAFQAECLNGGEHDFQPMTTAPVEFTQMECPVCRERRQPTDAELEAIIKESNEYRKLKAK